MYKALKISCAVLVPTPLCDSLVILNGRKPDRRHVCHTLCAWLRLVLRWKYFHSRDFGLLLLADCIIV